MVITSSPKTVQSSCPDTDLFTENKSLIYDSRTAKDKKEADTIDSVDNTTHEGNIDDNAELILSQRQLADRFGSNTAHQACRKRYCEGEVISNK